MCYTQEKRLICYYVHVVGQTVSCGNDDKFSQIEIRFSCELEERDKLKGRIHAVYLMKQKTWKLNNFSSAKKELFLVRLSKMINIDL